MLLFFIFEVTEAEIVGRRSLVATFEAEERVSSRCRERPSCDGGIDSNERMPVDFRLFSHCHACIMPLFFLMMFLAFGEFRGRQI